MAYASKKSIINVPLEPEIREQVRELARAKGLSSAEWMRQLVQAAVKKAGVGPAK